MNMQAVILAAGQSSRFYPLANGMHKSMFKLCGKPILEHTILALEKAGIKNLILIVDSKETIKSYFSDGKKLNVSITYVVQQKPLGAGNGLVLAKEHIKGDFLLLNGSHVDINDFVEKLLRSKLNSDKAVLLVKEKKETWNNGVIKIKGDQVEDLVEKPKKGEEPSKLCVVGIYLFSKGFLDELKNTPYEHYQLERAIASFAKKHFVRAIEIHDETVSLKYPWDLLSLKNYLFKTIKKSVSKGVKIAKSAEIIGEVVIEDNAIIAEGAKIKGPCFIGKNAYIGNHAVLRNGVDIGENAVIGAYMEVKNSIIMASSKTHSGFIGDSIIGENCRIGAQFCTANVRLDRTAIKVNVNGQIVETGRKFLGAVSGKNVHIGVKSSTMPGVLLGQNCVIGPSTVVTQNIEENTKYYSKFQGIVIKK